MNERIGQQLGNYRLIKLLGKGGFADVYLGEHVYLNNQAAVKVLFARMGEADLEVFLREARILVKLIHPHIVRVLDFGETDAIPFLVMDYAPGGTMRQRYRPGTRVPLPLVVMYVKQVAEALQYAHDQRLVHCDIKPENILLDKNDQALLSDFGIATVAQSTHYSRVGGDQAAGTIGYMAPEQIQSHPRAASDQYALGVVAYEWLCGERPFRGSFTEVAVKHTMVPPPSLREYLPNLPLAVEHVVLTALAKTPDARFPSVWAFAQALEKAAFDPPQEDQATEFVRPLPLQRPTSYPSQPGIPAPITPIVRVEPRAQIPGGPVSQGWFSDLTTPQPVAPRAERAFVPATPPAQVGQPYRRSERDRGFLLVGLILLLVLLLLGGAAALAFRIMNPVSNNSIVTVTSGPAASLSPTSIPSPTQAPPSPTPSSPSPTVATSPPSANYPAITGNYSGNIHNSLVNEDASMTLAVSQNQADISGQFTVSQPLSGSGPYTGTVDTNNNVQFTVHSSEVSAPILFKGTVHADKSMSGTYCSVNPSGQCDTNYGGYGTWHVSKE
jgi:serine/threonine protein kinase